MSANIQTTEKIIAMLKAGTNIFLTGAAGTGKSYTVNELKDHFTPLLLAPTGIAATHIGGETLHSFFGFPVDKEAGMKKYNREKKELMRDVLKKFDLLIIDEISMVHDYLLTWMEIRFAEVGVELPAMLFVGDFYQLPPVCRDDVALYAFESEFWHKHGFHTIELTEVKRTDNIAFAKALMDLRKGEVSKKSKKILKELASHKISDDYTHLYSTNKDAFAHNRYMLDKIKNKTFVYEMSEGFLGEESQRFEYDLKKGFLKSRFENKLFLKEGAIVIFTKNDKDKKFYNGKKGIVTKLERDAVYIDGVRIDQETIEINSYKKVNGKTKEILIGRVTQYPMKLGYAITIHKSQGMSIDKLHVDISYIFAPGQAYVALSRARDPQNTSLNMGYKDASELFYTDSTVDEFYGEDGDTILGSGRYDLV